MRSFPLVGALALVLLLELVGSRIAWRMTPDLMLPRGVQVVIGFAGSFLFHAATLLAVVLSGLAVTRLLTQPSLLPTGGRPLAMVARAVSVVAMVGFVFITVLGVWLELPGRLQVYLVALYALLVAQLVRGAWPATVGRGRVRVWLSLVVVAAVAHFGWLLLSQLGHDDRGGVARAFTVVGEALMATAAASAPFCLLTRRSPRVWPLAAGAVVTAGVMALAARDWLLAATLARWVFGLQLPTPLFGVGLEAVALGSWTAATLALLAERGTPRLRGFGLALVGLAGYRLEAPGLAAASLVGVLCILESYLRERAQVVPPESWLALVRRMAQLLGTTETTVSGTPGFEEARIAGSAGDEAAEVRLLRRGFMLARVELAVGHAPTDEAPPLSLQRRGVPRLGRRDGLEVATGDLDFDASFIVFDARRLDAADSVLDDERRPRLRATVDGWLGVWPGRGARLCSVGAETFGLLLDESPRAEAAQRELLALLADVKRRG